MVAIKRKRYYRLHTNTLKNAEDKMDILLEPKTYPEDIENLMALPI